MVKFELRQIGEAQQLIIKDGDNNTSLPIHRPLTGKHAHTLPVLDNIPSLQSSSWSFLQEGLPLLRSPLHTASTSTDRSFSTLVRRIISGEVKWGDTLRVYGRFRQPLKYSEWVEEILDREGLPLRAAEIYDVVLASLFTYNQNSTIMRAFYEAWCTDTNFLHTSAGELSITPWDLHIIGGLPTFGSIYDETVPYPDELDNTFYDNTLLPPSCKFLFLAFHRLVGAEKKNTVSPTAWVKYWFKGGLQHKHPRPQPLAKSVLPTKVGNSSSANGSSYDWLPETKRVFSDLDVPTALFDEVYLAAFLSCWLCIFVFPTGSTAYIRPTVFKPASLMASGKVLGLSFLVLAAIYKGLNTIALSPTPGLSSTCFPQHYLITWMANYFGTHHRKKQLIAESKMSEFSGEYGAKSFSEEEARTEIHSGKWISWNAVSFAKRYTQNIGSARRVIDDEQRNRFVALRPCLLSFRWKNAFNLEPYNPHRFCRQFGFSQRIPHESNKENIRSSMLDEGMKHWLLSQHEYPDTTVSIPSLPKSFKESITSNFSKWWEKVHGNYLIEGRKLLIKSIQGISPPPWEKKYKTLNIGAASEDSGRPLTGPTNDIHNKLNSVCVNSNQKNINHFVSSNFPNCVMPLQYHTNERYQVCNSELVGSACNASTSCFTGNARCSKKSSGHMDNEQSLVCNDNKWAGNSIFSNGGLYQAHNDTGMVDRGSCLQGLDDLTEISLVVQGNEGNVHTGAPPPWFDSSEKSLLEVGHKFESESSNIASSHQKSGKIQKLNPKRVGAAWAEKRKIELEMEKRGEVVSKNFDDNWLPNFGSVWQAGTRKESKKEFNAEKKLPLKTVPQSDTLIEIQPYVSKRKRKDMGNEV